MGIPKFYGEYILRLPAYAKPKSWSNISKELNGSDISTLLIDANGLLHPVAQKTYAYSDDPKKVTKEDLNRVKNSSDESLLGQYKVNLFKKLDDMVLRVNPKTRIIIAVDGVAPAAKINQQRSRRYGAKGLSELNNYKFDSNCLTPGTRFMYEVDLFLEEWCDTYRKNGLDVIYSSHLEHGEGEHKMFWIAKDVLDDNEFAAVDGLDGDLFMLSLTAKFKVLLMRNDPKKGETYVYINDFKKYIVELLVTKGRETIEQRCYEDFIVMLYLIGNDFLPRLLMIDNVYDAVQKIANAHRKLNSYITIKSGKLDFDVLTKFFYHLSQEEVDMLASKTNSDFFYPHTVLHTQNAKKALKKSKKDYMMYMMNGLYEGKDEISIANEYLDGVSWVFKYYTTKEDWSKLWIYKADIPPLMISLYKALLTYKPSDIITQGTTEKHRKGFSIPQQLVSVIPPISIHLLEPYKGLAELISTGGALEDLCPYLSLVLVEGVRREQDAFMGKRLLPPFDVERVLECVK